MPNPSTTKKYCRPCLSSMTLMSSGGPPRDTVPQSLTLYSFFPQCFFFLPFRLDIVYWLIFKSTGSSRSLICHLNESVSLFILATQVFNSKIPTMFFFYSFYFSAEICYLFIHYKCIFLYILSTVNNSFLKILSSNSKVRLILE